MSAQLPKVDDRGGRGRTPLLYFLAVFVALAVVALSPAAAGAKKPSFLSRFSKITDLASTVPASGPGAGDQNPYGTAIVPRSTGTLHKGDVLVSNFNDASNQQGTGSTIMQVSPGRKNASVFAHIPSMACAPSGGIGLTTALVALSNGFVVVGSLPAPGGMIANDGCLIVVSSSGNVVTTFSGGPIQGPWDMTAAEHGKSATLFFSNVLTGNPATSTGKNGTVVRMVLHFGAGAPTVTSEKVIGMGFAEHLDPSALVVGPTGVGLGGNGVLYVADTAGNRIAAISNAMSRTTPVLNGGKTVTHKGQLNSPLGLAIAPGGDILTVNAGDGKIVETTPGGSQVAHVVLVGTKPHASDAGGDLFGLAVLHKKGVYFVDDSGMTTPSMGKTVGAFANSLEFLH